MNNHAFLIIVHKQPSLLRRILQILEKTNHYFYIHVDAKVENYNEFTEVTKDIANVHFTKKRISVFWAGFNMVKAELALLEEAKQSPVHFSHYHLISGSDYPLRSNEQFDDFFENNPDSYMCYNYEQDMEKWEPIYNDKANRYYNWDHHGIIGRAIIRIGNSRLGPHLLPLKPIENFAGGWQWFSWSDNVVNFVLDYIKKNPRYLKRFKYTGSPDEHFFTTMLASHLEKLKINKHFPLRYISWEPYREIEQKHRPYDMNEDDYDRIINSAAFFCRKVEEQTSAKLLDMIDAQRGNEYSIKINGYFF